MNYVAPQTVAEACAQWAETDGAFYLAGATDLLPQVRLGRHAPKLLVDLKRIRALKEIRQTAQGDWAVGAAVPLAQVAGHLELRAHYPLLAECCAAVGSYPLRNRATMAGNICNASPAADTAAALLALQAKVEVCSTTDRRTIEIDRFFTGPGKTALRRGELVTAIVLPQTATGCRGSYLRLSRRRGVDLASVAVLVGAYRPNGAQSERRHRICLIAVAPTPKRVAQAEAVLDRQGYTGGAIERVAELTVAAASPIDDVRATAAYRREMVSVLTRRGVRALAAMED